jgi:hypothetical protein
MASIRNVLLGGMILCGLACSDDPDREPEERDASGAGRVDATTPDGRTADPNMDGGAGRMDAEVLTDGATDVIDAGDGGTPLVPVGGNFILATTVFGQASKTDTYVGVVTPYYGRDVEFTGGLQFSGLASVAEFEGKIFIADGAAPIVRRYSVAPNTKALVEEGSISFASLGPDPVSVAPNFNTFISATKAYLAIGNGTIVVWNPTSLMLSGEIPGAAPIQNMPNLNLGVSPGVARAGRFYRTVFWVDFGTYTHASTQYFATYDTATDQLLSVVPETRCLGLATSSIDSTGTIYFSNWNAYLPDALLHGKPSGCALRLPAGTDVLDASWSLDFSAKTGGHEGAQLTAIGSNRALFSAFREENVVLQPAPPPYDLLSSEQWETWSIDLSTEQAMPAAGVPLLANQQTVFTVGGRTFLFYTNSKKQLNGTTVYEILPDSTSRVAFTIEGWGRALLPVP